MSKKLSFAAAGLVMAAGATAFAHGGATGIVKERMDAMGDMGDVVKRLSAMMRGETAYDADAVKAGAKTIRSHAGSTMTGLFPEGERASPVRGKAGDLVGLGRLHRAGGPA
ncbi:MAG: cytochrome c [Tepidamorphaceae bacterium]